MYAVIKTGGKQYRVAEGDVIEIEKLDSDVGADVSFENVLMAGNGQDVKIGDTIIEFDLALLEEKAKSTLTPVVISNMDEIKELHKLSGSITVGESAVLRINK